MKKFTNVASGVNIEMSASQQLSAMMDSTYPKTSTLSIKNQLAIRGLSGDNTEAFVRSLLDSILNGQTGSFSFKVTQETAAARKDDIVKIADAMHKESDYILQAGYDLLSDDDKAAGLQIAIQNEIRIQLLNMVSSLADGAGLIDRFLTSQNLVLIPDTAQLEARIVGGSRLFKEPVNPVGYKSKVDTSLAGSPTVWTKNSDMYGRKRIPLKNEQATSVAFKNIAAYVQLWEQFWTKKGIPTNDGAVVDALLEWIGTLPHQDHVIVRNTLTEQQLIDCKKTAQDYYNQMMKGQV